MARDGAIGYIASYSRVVANEQPATLSLTRVALGTGYSRDSVEYSLSTKGRRMLKTVKQHLEHLAAMCHAEKYKPKLT